MIVPIVGTIRKSPAKRQSTATSLSDALFTTTQQRVLGALFGQPSRAFYANELIELTRGGCGAIQRELTRLAASGLVTVRSVGNQKHYQANPDAPIFEELRRIAEKTFALGAPLAEALSEVSKRVSAAFVFGSVAKRQDSATSDIDLMVISDTVGYPEIFRGLEEARQRLGRPLNVTVFTRAEFESRRIRKDSFLTRVLAQPKIWIIGCDDDLSI